MPRIAMTFAVMLVLTAAEMVQLPSDPGSSTASNQTTILVTTIIGFLSLLVTQGVSMWRDARSQRSVELLRQEERADVERQRRQERDDAIRQREWDMQDRITARDLLRRQVEADREELRQHAELQRLETLRTAAALAKVSNANRDVLVDKIDQNTKLTEVTRVQAADAYRIGNDFARRLEEIRQEISTKGTQIDNIEAVGEDTNVKVSDLGKSPPLK